MVAVLMPRGSHSPMSDIVTTSIEHQPSGDRIVRIHVGGSALTPDLEIEVRGIVVVINGASFPRDLNGYKPSDVPIIFAKKQKSLLSRLTRRLRLPAVPGSAVE